MIVAGDPIMTLNHDLTFKSLKLFAIAKMTNNLAIPSPPVYQQSKPILDILLQVQAQATNEMPPQLIIS